ncbi:MAG: hypothetical protein ACKOTZ_08955, partial [Chloroflexota bacterium]
MRATRTFVFVATLGLLASIAPVVPATAAPDGTRTRAADPGTISIAAAPSVRWLTGSTLTIDVDPGLPGTKNWNVVLQRESGGSWVEVFRTTTSGKTEARSFTVPAGTYRVFVPPQLGYKKKTSTGKAWNGGGTATPTPA